MNNNFGSPDAFDFMDRLRIKNTTLDKDFELLCLSQGENSSAGKAGHPETAIEGMSIPKDYQAEPNEYEPHGTMPSEAKRALVFLLRQGVILSSQKSKLFEAICRYEAAVRRHLSQVYLKLVLDEKAGVIMVACSNKEYIMQCGQAVGPIDVSIALEHISLQATELGLATCWIGSFDTDKVRQVLDIPEDVAIIELMALGYPAEQGEQNTRLPIEKIVCYNKWQF